MGIDQKTLHQLNEIGIALSKERNTAALLEKILFNAKMLTGADGGTIYTVTPEKMLRFEIVLSDSLNFHVGGTSEHPVPFPDLPLYLSDGKLNETLMGAYVVKHKKMLNIKDVYNAPGFDFSAAQRFDALTGHHTKAVLTIPMLNHEEEVIAILQLINPAHGHFTKADEHLSSSLASQASVALTNQLLVKSLLELFESLAQVIAEAIDEKSPVTANHSRRVPIIALSLAKAVNESDEEPFKEIHFSDEELYELRIASLLHDCGKIATPVHLIERKNKLDAIMDRIDLVDARVDAQIEKIKTQNLLKKLKWLETHYPDAWIEAKKDFAAFDHEMHNAWQELNEERLFLHQCNEGKVEISESVINRLNRSQDLLTTDELEHLKIPKGNLTKEEIQILRNHVLLSERMLRRLHFPKGLRKVPDIAASHHERIDGKGYPRGLKKEEISIQARILAIADVFEALSAPDRPYKKKLPLSEVYSMMQQEAKEGHLDSELLRLFFKSRAWMPFARQFLSPDQLDI